MKNLEKFISCVDVICYIISATYAIYYLATRGHGWANWIHVIGYSSAAILYCNAIWKLIMVAFHYVGGWVNSHRKEN